MIAQIFIPIGCVLAAAYVLLFLFALFRSDAMIFPAPPSKYGPEIVTTTLTSASGYRIPVLLHDNPEAEFTILFSHGNGEDLGDSVEGLAGFQAYGFQVVAYDYPGYGLSTGRATEANTYEAADAVYKWLTKEKGIPPERIIVYGRSLGSGPSIHLAGQHPAIAGIILEGAFASTFRVMLPINILPFDKFENEKKLRSIDIPLLVIHGERDQVVPFWHAKANLNASPSSHKSYLWIPGGGHVDAAHLASDAYWKSIHEFVISIKTRETITHDGD